MQRGSLQRLDEPLRQPDTEAIARPVLLDAADLHRQMAQRRMALGEPEVRTQFRLEHWPSLVAGPAGTLETRENSTGEVR